MAAPSGGPPSTDRPETRNARSDRPLTGAAARARILHWGFIAGGLVTISDLAGLAYANATGAGADELAFFVGFFLSVALFGFAGNMVARETGRIIFGVLAAAMAGAIDGLVVGAGSAIQASAFPDGAPVEVFLQSMWLNLTIALIAGLAGAWLNTISPRGKR